MTGTGQCLLPALQRLADDPAAGMAGSSKNQYLRLSALGAILMFSSNLAVSSPR
jgi:hypothetical protein